MFALIPRQVLDHNQELLVVDTCQGKEEAETKRLAVTITKFVKQNAVELLNGLDVIQRPSVATLREEGSQHRLHSKLLLIHHARHLVRHADKRQPGQASVHNTQCRYHRRRPSSLRRDVAWRGCLDLKVRQLLV